MNYKSLMLVLSLAVMPSSWAVEKSVALIAEKGRGLKACEVYTALTISGTPNGIAGVHARLENKMNKSVNALCPAVEVEADVRAYQGLLVKKGPEGATTYSSEGKGDKIVITEKDAKFVVKETRGGKEVVLYSAGEGEATPEEAKKLDKDTLKVLDLVVTECATQYTKTKGKNEIGEGTSTSKVEKKTEGTTVTKTYVLKFEEINFPKANTLARHALEVTETVFQPKALKDNRGPATVECREIKVFE